MTQKKPANTKNTPSLRAPSILGICDKGVVVWEFLVVFCSLMVFCFAIWGVGEVIFLELQKQHLFKTVS